LIPAFVAAVILILWAGARYYRRWAQPFMAAPLQPLMRLKLDLGSEVPPESRPGVNAILSPDGAAGITCPSRSCFTRRLDQAIATELLGTEGAHAHFFSPDGLGLHFPLEGS
jgi:hypothetical protein